MDINKKNGLEISSPFSYWVVLPITQQQPRG